MRLARSDTNSMNWDDLRTRASRALGPVRPSFPPKYPWGGVAQQTDCALPEYYFAYLLLVDFLGYPKLGRDEKVAWKIPVEINGRVLYLEHRKMGFGVFSYESRNCEDLATQLIRRLNKAVAIASPYFDWRAKCAVANSEINVLNRSNKLTARFNFLDGLLDEKLAEIEQRSQEVEVKKLPYGIEIRSIPGHGLKQEASWLAISVIESFFSWTEHVFVLLAIIQGKCVTGDSVQELAKKEWADKFKVAIDINDSGSKKHYDNLVQLRRHVRNFIAHGAIGKQFAAFRFHSAAGAIPAKFPSRTESNYFESALILSESAGAHQREKDLIHGFMEHVKTGVLAPAWVYIDSGLPLILTEAKKGKYQDAMKSVEAMEEYTDWMAGLADYYANMEW